MTSINYLGEIRAKAQKIITWESMTSRKVKARVKVIKVTWAVYQRVKPI